MMRFWSTAYVTHLEAEIEWLRIERQKETQRANVAVAELVRLRTEGQANVHPTPLIADREVDVQKELTDLMGNSEFAQAGA